ncbi:MAG: hypothetical protein AAFY57_03420 [Cyanobacteria bacterium J06642_2]
MPHSAFSLPIGQLLRQACLLSDAQVDVVLRDQADNSNLRFGDILTLRGWLKQKTIDFFVEEWPQASGSYRNKPLGQYFKAAGLLEEPQIQELLTEQRITGLRFGALAAFKGWLKPETVNFFLEALVPESERRSHFTDASELMRPAPRPEPAVGIDDDEVVWIG